MLFQNFTKTALVLTLCAATTYAAEPNADCQKMLALHQTYNPAVQMHDVLQARAQAFAEQLQRERSGGHHNGFLSRVREYVRFDPHENVACHFTAEEAMRAWLSSGGHGRNIRDKTFTHVGIGCAGGEYWVVIFVRIK